MGEIAHPFPPLGGLAPDVLPTLIHALGRPSFPRVMLRSLRDLLGVDHLSIITLDFGSPPHVIAAESLGNVPLAKMAGQIYERSSFKCHDPSLDLVGHLDASWKEPLLLRVKSAQIEDRAYRKQIYLRFGLAERLSFLALVGTRWYTLNLYRTRSAGGFNDVEFSAAKGAVAVITALVARHCAFRSEAVFGRRRPGASCFEQLLDRLNFGLTSRQTQVCARALTGMTNQAIALDLGIKASTVATLRKRAYAAMNISSLNELFGRCLARSISSQRGVP